MKLQAGEYVAISQVETCLKMLPLVEQIYIHGDSRHSFVIAFVVPSPTNLSKVASDLKIEGCDKESLCVNAKVEKEFLKRLNEHGAKGWFFMSILWVIQEYFMSNLWVIGY